jgi:holo-[acyl-carrier protein] synthase
VAYCRRKKISAQHFAVRFAAKEAVWKALGQSGISHRDIGVVNAPDGAPQVVLKGRKAGQFSLSLSHTRAFAVAVAVYCGR